VLRAAGGHVAGPLRLVLDRELVVAVDCPRCGWRGAVMRPRVKVKAGEATCPNCREPARPELASAIEDSSQLAQEPLGRVGIPPYDILRVDGPADSGFFLLAGDRDTGTRDGEPAGERR